METGIELGEGRYRITGEIARGGMGTVFRAYDSERAEICAIKLLSPGVADDQVRRRFYREAATMTRLQHPNIVRVYDSGATDAGPYLVMDFAELGSAWDWVQRHGPMPPRLAVHVVTEVLKGLAHAHANGVVHRDVKPQNILFDWRGTPKLTDFGVARLTDGSNVHTTTSGTILGTYHYLAPEIREDARQARPTSDIYATAGCLYALVMGRHPRELHGADAFPDVLEGVPKPLQAVIRTATRFDPDERFPSVEAFAEALHAAQSELPELGDNAMIGIGTPTAQPRSRVLHPHGAPVVNTPADGAAVAAAITVLGFAALAVVAAAFAAPE